MAPQLARHAPGRFPTPPPLPENLLLRLHRKLPSAPPASTQEVSESENRPATRGTAYPGVQGDSPCSDRGNDRRNDRAIATLHFLLPTNHENILIKLEPLAAPFRLSDRGPRKAVGRRPRAQLQCRPSNDGLSSTPVRVPEVFATHLSYHCRHSTAVTQKEEAPPRAARCLPLKNGVRQRQISHLPNLYSLDRPAFFP